MGWTISIGYFVINGAVASLSGRGEWTNAEDIHQLEGKANIVGASSPWAGAEYIQGKDYWGVAGEVGTPWGAEAHAGAQHTILVRDKGPLQQILEDTGQGGVLVEEDTAEETTSQLPTVVPATAEAMRVKEEELAGQSFSWFIRGDDAYVTYSPH